MWPTLTSTGGGGLHFQGGKGFDLRGQDSGQQREESQDLPGIKVRTLMEG